MTSATQAEQPETRWATWRYVWSLTRFRPRRQLINLGFVIFGWGTSLLPGLAAKIVFDRLGEIGPASSLSWLWWPMAILVMRFVAVPIMSVALQSTNGAFAFANAARLQRNVLTHVLDLPGAAALRRSPGETVSRLRDDTEAVIWYPIMLNNVVGSTVVGVGALVIMWTISPAITLGAFVPLVMIVLLVETVRARLVAYRRSHQIRTAEVAGFIGDVFASAPAIQLGNAQTRTVDRFRELNARRRHAAVRDRLLESLLDSAFWVVNLGMGLVLVFAGRSLQSGSFTLGSLALFVFYLEAFREFSRDIGAGLAGYEYQKVSFERLDDLVEGRDPGHLGLQDEIHERGDLPSAAPDLAPRYPLDRLVVDGLTYVHGDHLHRDPERRRGVRDASFELERGTFTVVVGRVGSGKSTLLKSVLGLLPAEGTITWNGEAIDPTTFMVPPHAAYTPQVPRLFSDSLADNILLGHDGDLDRAIHLAVMDDDLRAMPDGLRTMLGSRGVRLSGGQLQRTAAARMFVRQPELVVCDDLSSALDVRTEAALWNRLAEIDGRTVLAVSHRHIALLRSDQVVVLVDGRVDDVGTLDELLGRNVEMQYLWRLDRSAQ